MSKFMIGKKAGMTQLFDEDGLVHTRDSHRLRPGRSRSEQEN